MIIIMGSTPIPNEWVAFFVFAYTIDSFVSRNTTTTGQQAEVFMVILRRTTDLDAYTTFISWILMMILYFAAEWIEISGLKWKCNLTY